MVTPQLVTPQSRAPRLLLLLKPTLLREQINTVILRGHVNKKEARSPDNNVFIFDTTDDPGHDPSRTSSEHHALIDARVARCGPKPEAKDSPAAKPNYDDPSQAKYLLLSITTKGLKDLLYKAHPQRLQEDATGPLAPRPEARIQRHGSAQRHIVNFLPQGMDHIVVWCNEALAWYEDCKVSQYSPTTCPAKEPRW